MGDLGRVMWVIVPATVAVGGTAASYAAAPLEVPAADSVGVPITDDVVLANCSSCHAVDEAGRMSRISYVRKTPEGWQTSIRRMVVLNDVSVSPDDARHIVRYLSNVLGLAPGEARPGQFEVERRLIDYTYEADEDTETTCKQCHSLGRVILQRRTKDEWTLLLATHRGFYPFVDFQAFRQGIRPENGRWQMDDAIDHLAEVFPFETAEWAAWSATMRAPRLVGTWSLSGHEPGRGPVFGRVDVAAGATPEEFTTTIEYTYARTGETVRRTGRSLVYTGFQWRGRSHLGSSDDGALREVMMVERDWRTITGRWFTGAYDELGVDVTLRRADGPVVDGVYPSALRTGGEHEVRIYGSNLPAGFSAATVDLGPGVSVVGVPAATAEMATLRVRVAQDAALGARDLFVGGASRLGALVVYDRVDRIKVTPRAGMARVGGIAFPKQLQQFEARGWHDGRDGEPNTADDLDLGHVDVTWSVEEYAATFDDDDADFVGRLDDTGLFTPGDDGPNPRRSRNRNNIGDVWVVATYQPLDPEARPLNARAHLLVTVPLYMRWEPWRVEQ